MKHRGRITFLILAGIILFASFLYFTRSREPVFEGRRLHEWVSQLHGGVGTNSITHELLTKNVGPESACQAIREIGPAAVPYLIHDLQAGPSRAADFAGGFLRKVPVLHLTLSRTTAQTEEARVRAALALYLLGPASSPALPVATRLLTSPGGSNCGTSAGATVLAALGDDGLRTLHSALNTNGSWTSSCAIWGLAQMGDRAVPVIPEILHVATVRQSHWADPPILEFWALDTLGADSGDMLNLVIVDLQNTNQWFNTWKAGWLDWLTHHAKISQPAVPSIIPALTNSDFAVRQAATNALFAIDAEKARGLGIMEPSPPSSRK